MRFLLFTLNRRDRYERITLYWAEKVVKTRNRHLDCKSHISSCIAAACPGNEASWR